MTRSQYLHEGWTILRAGRQWKISKPGHRTRFSASLPLAKWWVSTKGRIVET